MNKKILFYPSRPLKVTTIYKIIKKLDIGITKNKKDNYILGIYWKDRTYTKFKWPEKTDKLIINKNCNDISKRNVDIIHQKVFGYSTQINPKKYNKKYVQKMNKNGWHIGFIKSKKSTPHSWFIYQKLIDNSYGSMVLDFRVPIFKNNVPFIYKVYRPIKKRFNMKNSYVKLDNFKKIFNKKERDLIFKLCKEIRLDYGELDILRDNKSKKIYVIDVNKTPWGPFKALSKNLKKMALSKLADAFKKAFLN